MLAIQQKLTKYLLLFFLNYLFQFISECSWSYAHWILGKVKKFSVLKITYIISSSWEAEAGEFLRPGIQDQYEKFSEITVSKTNRKIVFQGK